ncbi:hypothetical protein WICPIJ_002007 [Wickerhamomyces pijperi]|uniref:BSD domain-containing protein n=1 Tax=Wickerhamomyces pijperi TaxID=599730 RepID=A0A9P8QAH5_WICPI|nr:hypothetical protein WICPIJ_002007 [Wickerhamomyces pijperi]
MDLFYEQAGTKTDSLETLTLPHVEDAKSKEINRKTEKSFEKLEDEISKTYNLVETKATGWGSSFSSFLNKNLNLDKYIEDTKKSIEELQLNDKLNEAKTKLNENVKNINKNLQTDQLIKDLSSKTTQYLDDLDKELEQVENTTGDYFNRFTNIIKSTVVVDQADRDMHEDEDIDSDEGNLLFNVASGSITSNRTEAQYNLLNTSKDLYLNNDSQLASFVSFEKQFNIDSKTEDIAQRLTNLPLQKLFNEIVPERISYSSFWCIYYYNVSQIQEREEKRKQLLNKNNTPQQQEESFDWEEDEEEEEEEIEGNKEDSAKTKSSSDGSYELNSVNSSTLEVNKAASSERKKEEEEDDEDDDWE